METVYVCGKCGGQIVCICTTKDKVTTAHVFCVNCDKEVLERGKTEGK